MGVGGEGMSDPRPQGRPASSSGGEEGLTPLHKDLRLGQPARTPGGVAVGGREGGIGGVPWDLWEGGHLDRGKQNYLSRGN